MSGRLEKRSSIAAIGRALLTRQMDSVDEAERASPRASDLMFLVRQASNPNFDEDSDDDEDFVADVTHGHKSVSHALLPFESSMVVLDDRLVAWCYRRAPKNYIELRVLRGAKLEPTELALFTSTMAVVARSLIVGKGQFAIYSALESNPTALLSVAPRRLLHTTCVLAQRTGLTPARGAGATT